MQTEQHDNRYAALRNRAEMLHHQALKVLPLTKDDKVAKLINELEIYEIELDMQRDEIIASQDALELEQAKLAGFFDAAPVGYVILDYTGTIQQINKKGTQLLSRTTQLIHGFNFGLCIHPSSRAAYFTFIEACKVKSEGAKCEVMMHIPGGAVQYMMLDGGSSTNGPAARETYYITMTDITDSKLEAQRILELTEAFDLSLVASKSGTWKTSIGNDRITLDRHAKQILGLNSSDEDYSLEYIASLFAAADRSKFVHINTPPMQEEHIDLELQLLPVRRRSRYILVKGRAVSDGNGNYYFTGIITDHTDRKKSLAIEEERRKVQQILLKKTAVESQEEERQKIAAVLHGSVCQVLYGVRYSLNNLKHRDALPEELFEAEDLLQQAITELRTLSAEMTSSTLMDFGLVASMQDNARRLHKLGYFVDTDLDLAIDRLTKKMQLYIFRIVQELINNSVKHSGTNSVKVAIKVDQAAIHVHVQDSGKGFDEGLESAIKNGSGIRGIANRVSLLNGQLELLSDEGAQFNIRIPLDPVETFLYE